MLHVPMVGPWKKARGVEVESWKKPVQEKSHPLYNCCNCNHPDNSMPTLYSVGSGRAQGRGSMSSDTGESFCCDRCCDVQGDCLDSREGERVRRVWRDGERDERVCRVWGDGERDKRVRRVGRDGERDERGRRVGRDGERDERVRRVWWDGERDECVRRVWWGGERDGRRLGLGSRDTDRFRPGRRLLEGLGERRGYQ
jgi:hypothetical protein